MVGGWSEINRGQRTIMFPRAVRAAGKAPLDFRLEGQGELRLCEAWWKDWVDFIAARPDIAKHLIERDGESIIGVDDP